MVHKTKIHKEEFLCGKHTKLSFESHGNLVILCILLQEHFTYHTKRKITKHVEPKQTRMQVCLIFLSNEIIKMLTGTKDEVYHWSYRIVWNNGVLDVAQTDGSLVYLYIHISQAWALASKAQGWETKSSYHSHMCTCAYTHTHTCAHTHARSNTKGPLCSGYRQSCLAYHNTQSQSTTDDNSSLKLFKGRD